MSTTTTAASGSFSPITQGPVRTDAEFDIQNLSKEEQDVVTADEFIIFGRASIEQWNDPAPGEEYLYIEMDALEAKLDQLLALNNLSRRHDDTKVGEFREKHTLDHATTIHLDDDETLRFDAGDTLKTEVIREGEPLPDGSGPAQEDALWLVANVFGKEDTEGSVLSEETRLSSYYGHLDGFSVTVYTREYDQVDKGRIATEVDFLAVTIGEDELIKNKGSHFGVAEFQARFGSGHTRPPESDDAGTTSTGVAAVTAEASGLGQKLTMSIFNHIFNQSKEGLVAETIQVAQQSEQSLEDAATDVVGDDGDAEHIAEQAEERLQSISERLEQEEMERENLAAEVADELGMDKEEVMALFDELEAAANGESPDEPEEGDEPDEPDDPDEEAAQQGMSEGDVRDLVQQEVGDAVGDAVSEHLGDLEAQADEGVEETEGGDGGEKFVTQQEFDDRLNELSQQLETAVENVGETVADNVAQQMETAGTPDPAGGSATAESDIKDEVEGVVESMEFGRGDGGDN